MHAKVLTLALAIVGMLAASAVVAAAQALVSEKAAPSLCAGCHLASATPRSRAHLIDWQRSLHAAQSVNCESCHGGDPATIDPMRAHLSILGSEDPDSPVHRKNLPATCGKCHARSASQFAASKHATVLRTGAALEAPTCSTCHGIAGSQRPDPEEVRTQCAQCHGVGRHAGHPEYPAAAKLVMVQYSAARTMLDEARTFIPLLSDATQRASLEVEQLRALEAVMTTADALHTVNYDSIDEKLTVAFDRVVALIRRVMTIMPRLRP